MMKLLLFLITFLSSQLLFAQGQMFDICPLKVGEEIPTVFVADHNNQLHNLHDLATERPTILVFYRGAWCGYCVKHLAELNDIKKDVEALGFQIFGVTVDQSSKLEESDKKAASEIEVYSDAHAKAIEAFGLNWVVDDELFSKYKKEYNLDLEDWSGTDHHNLPVPAVFVVKDGVVQFQYVNPDHSIRLPADILLAILEPLSK